MLLLPNNKLLHGFFVFVGGGQEKKYGDKHRHHNNKIIIGYIYILWRLFIDTCFEWRVIKLTLDIFDKNSNEKKKYNQNMCSLGIVGGEQAI